MTVFRFQETVPAPTMLTSALGNGSTVWTDKEVGKAVKLSSADDSTMVLAEEGDDIIGFVGAIAIGTVNDGFSHGSVQVDGWKICQVGANQGATAMAVGDFVVADDQLAVGTSGLAKVKTASGRSCWRVMRILTGTGSAGSQVLVYEF